MNTNNTPPKDMKNMPAGAPQGMPPQGAPNGMPPMPGADGKPLTKKQQKALKKQQEMAAIMATSKYARKNRQGGPGGGPGGGPRRGPGGGGPRGGPPGHGPTEKAKDFKGSLVRTIKYVSRFKWPILFVALLCILSSIAHIFSPKVQGQVINVIQDAFTTGVLDTAELFKWVLLLGVIYVLSAAFSFIQQWTTAGVTQRLVFSLRKDVDEKLAKLPLKYYDSRTHGEILSRVTNDVDNVSNTLQQSITQVISSVITLVGVLVMMLSISWVLTLITMCITPLYIIVIYVIAPRSQRYFVGQQAALGDINGHVEEMYTGQKIVKAYGRENESIEEFNEINDRYYTYSVRAQTISGLIMPLNRLLGNFGYVLVCVVGGMFVANGSMRLGDVQAFMQYVRQFNQPIQQTSNMMNTLQSTIASAERIFEILDEPEEPKEASGEHDLKNPEGAVKFEHVKFGYDPDKILMQDLSIDVKKGETIAIVGPTGAGKTTLVNLLMRFYDVIDGKITVDGVDIRDMTRSGLRSMFGMVLQDTWLFNGTIRDNIAYGRPDATDEQIVAASKAARSDHFIRTLPDGYNTEINEEASNISQGQRQLLTVARAFLADPEILILDEATSSVDTRTEVLIQSAMNELMKNRTSFVIAHRLSTIRGADLILVMNHGTIVEQGTHESLLAEGGFYADLWQSQFAGRDLDEEEVG